VVLYCNKDHQKAHWPAYKSVCQGQAKPVETVAANILKQARSKTIVTSAPVSREAAAAAGFTVFSFPSAYPPASIPYTQTPLQERYLATIKGYQGQRQIIDGGSIELDFVHLLRKRTKKNRVVPPVRAKCLSFKTKLAGQ